MPGRPRLVETEHAAQRAAVSELVQAHPQCCLAPDEIPSRSIWVLWRTEPEPSDPHDDGAPPEREIEVALVEPDGTVCHDIKDTRPPRLDDAMYAFPARVQHGTREWTTSRRDALELNRASSGDVEILAI